LLRSNGYLSEGPGKKHSLLSGNYGTRRVGHLLHDYYISPTRITVHYLSP